MAAVASHQLLFHLSLPLDDHAIPEVIPDLPDIKPRFVLPLLDEHASGTEKLLGSLRRALMSPADVYGVPKGFDGEAGKTDIVEKVRVEQGEENLMIWEEAARENEAGPSRRPTFTALSSWDDIEGQDPTKYTGSTFLSETSPVAFDAFITTSERPFSLPLLKESGVLISQDSRHLLDLVMRATLGTTTNDALRWDKQENRFIYGQEGGRPVAVERVTARLSVGSFLLIGTALRRLEIMVDAQSSTPLTPTHHALFHAVSTYLISIKYRLSAAIGDCASEQIASWNRWTSALKDIHGLAEMLCEMMCWPINEARAQALPSHASTLLTHIYGHLLAHLSTAPPRQQRSQTVLALAYLLSRASTPFMTLLHQWVGLSDSSSIDEDTDPESQPWADLGISRTLSNRQPESEADGVRWHYDVSAKRMPGFIPTEARRTLFEAGRSLRLLRDASANQHPSCGSDWGIDAQWVWGEERSSRSSPALQAHTRRVRREIEYWRRKVRERGRPFSVSSSRLRGPPTKERRQLPSDFIQRAISATPEEQSPAVIADSKAMWSLFGQAPGTHLESTSKSALWASTPLAELHDFISHFSDPSHPLLPLDTPTLPMYISTHLLGPLLAHSTLVATSLVSLFLDDLRFLDHLDVLRAFWLGGDIGFSQKVNGALFGKDGAGAGEALGLGRRARTRVRLGLGGTDAGVGDEDWGIGLGLGLSERQRWPAGGAELAYALRTTLMDEESSVDTGKGPVWEGIEDRVSFAVRALPEGKADGRRASWMDPQAIEALDFLYLSYSPPSSISSLLPTSIMIKYQTIHNLLLRLSRVNTVIRTLYWDVTHQSESTPDPVKVGVDSGLKRPPSGGRQQSRVMKAVLMSASSVEHRLHRLRFRMSHFVAALSRYVLDTAIGSNWDVMRRRLERLKRRIPGLDESRPPTPLREEDNDFVFEPVLEDDEEEAEPISIGQLQSIHSLVLYHHMTLDRILGSCLLSPHTGHQVTLKILTALFGLVLDLGKLVKEVERGFVGLKQGEARIKGIAADWEEKEAVFLHALERLSLRTNKSPLQRSAEQPQGHETEHDLDILLNGVGVAGEESGADLRRHNEGGGQLQELLLRLKLGSASDKGRGGRWKDDEAAV